MRESPGSLRPGYVDPPNILEVIGPTPTTLLIISAGLLANCWLLSGVYSLTSGGAGRVRGLRELPLEAFSLSLKNIYFFDVKTMFPLRPGLDTKTNPAVPNTRLKPQAFGCRAKEAAGGTAQNLARPTSCQAPLQRQGGQCSSKAQPSHPQN